MSVDVKEFGDVRVIYASGNLMSRQACNELYDKVREIVDQGYKKIVIDLSKVKQANSAGLGTLMGCLTSIRNMDGDLKLSGITEKMKSLFMITKLITLFDTYSTPEGAVKVFSVEENSEIQK